MKDEHEGMGGSYVVNPTTGKRELVHRTERETKNTIDEQPIDAPANKAGKGKD